MIDSSLKYDVKQHFSDLVKIVTQNKEKNPLILAVDPGLKGGFIIYYHKKRRFWCGELPTKKKIELLSGDRILKTVLDLKKLVDLWHDVLLISQSTEMIMVIEKPLKLSQSALKTYTTSAIDIGKILGIFETHFVGVTKSFSFVAPISWSSGFDNKLCQGKRYDASVKKQRMRALVEEFGFDRSLFFSSQGRFKDGISDACALFLWFVCLGKKEDCRRLF